MGMPTRRWIIALHVLAVAVDQGQCMGEGVSAATVSGCQIGRAARRAAREHGRIAPREAGQASWGVGTTSRVRVRAY